MSQYKRIFILGHPGSGKALLAKTVAEKLGWQFIDADMGLEYNIGRGLDDILGKQGKEAFYECQSEILVTLKGKENIVVATDSSIVCSEKNQQLLSSEYVVFLKVSTLVQMERNARNPLPLLSVPDMKIFLDTLHSERDPLNELVATLSINGDGNTLDEHVLHIIKPILEAKDKGAVPVKLNLEKKDSTLFHKVSYAPVHLSEQQALCLKLLSQGKSSKVIARDMKISYRTVEGTIAKMMEQLGCSSSKELIALYYDQP